MVAMAALVLAPSLSLAQHGGHGGGLGGGGGHHEEPPTPPARPRRDPPSAPAPPRGPTQIYVLVDGTGFSPREIPLKVGESAEIILLRRTDETCAKEILVPDLDIRLALPLDQPVRFALKPTKAGRIRFACGHGHLDGEFVVG